MRLRLLQHSDHFEVCFSYAVVCCNLFSFYLACNRKRKAILVKFHLSRFVKLLLHLSVSQKLIQCVDVVYLFYGKLVKPILFWSGLYQVRD